MDETCAELEAGEVVTHTGVDVDAVVQALDTELHVLPEAAIREAQRHRDLVAPRLIEVLQCATAAVRAGGKIERNGPFFALFLLWEFKAKEAWPAFREAFSLPDDGAHKLFGDADENLPAMIATLAPEPTAAAAEFVDDRNLDGFLRWNAANTYRQLAADGKITREDAVQRLTEHLQGALDTRDDDVIVSGLVYCLADLAAAEAMPEIERAFAADAVDESMIDLPTVREMISEVNSATENWITSRRPSELTDTYEELRGWASFQPREKYETPEVEAWDRPLVDIEDESPEWPRYDPEQPITVRYDDAHVGRNEPCPCGSGRKFKKCCGSRAKAQIDL